MFKIKKPMLFTIMFSLFFVGLGLGGQDGANIALTIKMDQNGENRKFIPNGKEVDWLNKNDTIKLIVNDTSCCCKDYHYLAIVNGTQIERKIPIHGLDKGINTMSTMEPDPKKDKKHTIIVTLGASGQKYTVQLMRYDSLEKKLQRKDGAIIFFKEFKTHSRVNFGLDVGVFFPIHNTQEKVYSIKYEGPNDPLATISEETLYRSRILILAAYYPFKFEPSRNLKNKIGKRIKLNFGTEISKNVLERFYFGIGVELKGVSISLLGSFGQEDALDPEYTPFMFVDPAKISTVPLKKNKRLFRAGIAITVPFEFASGFLGKIFGL